MNYPNFYPQMQPFMPQYQQQPINRIAGKVVNSFEEIMANDVPMDSIAIFPKADRSEIELRQWNANGTISKIVYKPVEEVQEEQVDTFKVYMEGINERFDKLEKMLKPTTRAKKEVEE